MEGFSDDDDAERDDFGLPTVNTMSAQASRKATINRPAAIITKVDDSKQKQEYKFREVVRDREQRQALKGQSCFRCKTFYDAVGIDEDAQRDVDLCNECSRHRDNEPIQNTPENFYDLDV